jgi:hypothetical protein
MHLQRVDSRARAEAIAARAQTRAVMVRCLCCEARNGVVRGLTAARCWGSSGCREDEATRLASAAVGRQGQGRHGCVLAMAEDGARGGGGAGARVWAPAGGVEERRTPGGGGVEANG